MYSFKDFIVVDLKPGEDEYIKYRNQKRRRGAMSSGEGGPVGESVEPIDLVSLIAEEKDMSKMLMLARIGLVDNVTTFKRVVKKLDSEKTLTPPERDVIYGIFNKLSDMMTNDQAIYNKVRKNLQKEGLEDPSDNPCWKGYKPVGTKKKDGKEVPNCVPEDVDQQFDAIMEAPLIVQKGALGKMLTQMVQDAVRNNKQADLEKIAKALGKKLTMRGNKVVIEGFEDLELSAEELAEAVLTPVQRMKKKLQIKRMKLKLKKGRKIMKQKRADSKRIQKRSRRQARAKVFAKYAKGKKKSEMSYAQRAQAEKKVETKLSLVGRLTKRLLPKVRKADQIKKKIVTKL